MVLYDHRWNDKFGVAGRLVRYLVGYVLQGEHQGGEEQQQGERVLDRQAMAGVVDVRPRGPAGRTAALGDGTRAVSADQVFAAHLGPSGGWRRPLTSTMLDLPG